MVQRQHPLLKLLHLQGLERRYTDEHGPASAERIAVLCRQATVHEVLAERAETAADRDEHRARAAALRQTRERLGDAAEPAGR
ncbi:hypothetical protein ACLFMI_11185 [Pseudonocardia nantongensis]|uniref:hypothetical protein n=1 Tax=Pseudonocardia nantongensis TaxID=1181885 RepID=UPI00397E652B